MLQPRHRRPARRVDPDPRGARARQPRRRAGGGGRHLRAVAPTALDRLAEAKGAAALLLAECYVRRDQVALLAFRGRGADLLLPPTRSLVRARRSLAGLPGATVVRRSGFDHLAHEERPAEVAALVLKLARAQGSWPPVPR